MVVELKVTNDRGFYSYAELEDSYGASVKVLESSSASGPHCWIMCYGGGIRNNDGSAHLTPEQAREVVAGLQMWLDQIPERWGEA